MTHVPSFKCTLTSAMPPSSPPPLYSPPRLHHHRASRPNSWSSATSGVLGDIRGTRAGACTAYIAEDALASGRHRGPAWVNTTTTAITMTSAPTMAQTSTSRPMTSRRSRASNSRMACSRARRLTRGSANGRSGGHDSTPRARPRRLSRACARLRRPCAIYPTRRQYDTSASRLMGCVPPRPAPLVLRPTSTRERSSTPSRSRAWWWMRTLAV